MLVYTRADHGSLPVQISDGSYTVGFPSGERCYANPQLLLRAVYYGPESALSQKSVPIGFERYFRLGRYLKAPLKGPDVFDLLSTPAPLVNVPVLGIDINARYIEIRRVFFKLVAKKVIAQGFDPEDVLQEVCRGLVVRNHGKCPFDVRKSSFAHYVVMVSNCIFSNYRRKWGKVNFTEVFEARGRDGEPCDVAESDIARGPESGARRVEACMAVENLTAYLIDRMHTLPCLREPQLRECMRALGDGDNNKEISIRLGVSEREAQLYTRYIKNGSRQWRAVRAY